MNLPIEIIVLFAIVGFAILWSILMFLTKLIKLRRYKPENDKGRLAEESRRRGLAIQKHVFPVAVKRPNLFSAANVNLGGEESDSRGETSRSPRKTTNPFRR